tara:strand:- start:3 stop:407 length:405 start_codon:yes stop_codon:yes gene_type:complete
MSEKKYTVIEADEDGYKSYYELTQAEVLEKINEEVEYLESECLQEGWNEYMECDWQSIPEFAEDKWLFAAERGDNRKERAVKLFKEMKQEMAEDLARLVKEQDFARRQLQHYEAQMVEFEILTRSPQEESEVIS